MALTLSGDDGVAGVNGSATTPAIQGTDTNTGLTFGTDTVNVVTGGSTRTTVDSSGRLLVGTSSQFGTSSRSSFYSFLQVEGNTSGSTGDGRITLGTGATTGSNTGLGSIYFCDTDGGDRALIRGYSTSAGGSENYPGYLTFWTNDGSANPTERMRITSNGSVLVDCTSLPGGSTQGFGFYPDTNVVQLLSASGSTSATAHAEFFNPNGKVGTITTDGTSTSYNQSSDYRLKENVVDLDGAIDRVKQLAPKRFNFIADANKTVDGFLAHEAQAVVPEAVVGVKDEVEVWREGQKLPDGVSVGDNKLDEDGNTIPRHQGIDQSKLVPLLTAALQEAISKIEALETRVAQLEGGAS